jgi:hypothetical protein
MLCGCRYVPGLELADIYLGEIAEVRVELLVKMERYSECYGYELVPSLLGHVWTMGENDSEVIHEVVHHLPSSELSEFLLSSIIIQEQIFIHDICVY